MEKPYKLKVKICLVGDSSVGKTSLIRRYVMDIFDDKYITTLGTKVSKKRIMIRNRDSEFDLTLSIWDVLGQKDFKGIHAMAFKGAKGTLLVCDLTRKETLNNLTNWVSHIKAVTGQIPMIILANKSDLTSEYAFTEAELQAFSTQLNTDFYMTSAKFGDNVIKTFFKLGELVINEIFLDENKK